jgi:uncharacterized protein
MLRMLFTLAAFAATALPAFGQMAITGTGSVSATPDTAYITLAVESNAPTANVALDSNTGNMKKLFKTLLDLGIPKKDISTSSFSVHARYGKYNEQTGEAPFLGYSVSNSVSVTVCQVDQLGKVLDQSVKSGANRVDSLHFGFKDQTKLMDDARKRAVEDAKRKADLYAQATGAKMGSVISISEERGYRPVRMYMAGEGATRSDVPINPGEQMISVNVTVVWKLIDKDTVIEKALDGLKDAIPPKFTPRVIPR